MFWNTAALEPKMDFHWKGLWHSVLCAVSIHTGSVSHWEGCLVDNESQRVTASHSEMAATAFPSSPSFIFSDVVLESQM